MMDQNQMNEMPGMDGMEMEMTSHSGGSFSDVMGMHANLLIADSVGIAIGIVAIIIISSAARRIGGRVHRALMYLIGGLCAMVVSFSATVAFTFLGAMDPNTMAIHSGLMVFGMILFIIAAQKFSSMTP